MPTSDQAPAAIAGSLVAGDGEIEDADYSDVTDDDHNPDGTRKSDTGNKESESAAGAPPIGTVGRGGSAAAVTAAGITSSLGGEGKHQPDPDDPDDHSGMPALDGPEVQNALAHAKRLAEERDAQKHGDTADKETA